MRALVATLFLASPAVAECPPPPDIQSAEDALYARIQAAPNEAAAQAVSNELWQLWTKAPDATAQELLDAGMLRRQAYDLEGSVHLLDELVAYCPDYAEGYNQRAFSNFLRGQYEEALGDLDLALERSPRHTGALSGKALTLMALDRGPMAQRVLREALALNPWLRERAYLVEPPGEEL